jgi:mono/diheme cytochrome c family protein
VQGAPACALCHSLDGTILTGPSLQDIDQTAQRRVEGQSARSYIRTSIVTPNAYKPAGFENGSMVQYYGQVLTEEQIEAVIIFLMAQ